ncbi:response regulator [Paenibacillus sp. PL2-23]|uniref:response regulator n=1 Tax=Paenibacillus sp. PL2-23 TaxID=2100729 RepID=UPI0030FACFF7
MRAILIDDERLALIRMEQMVRAIDGMEVLGMFMDPAEAMAQVATDRPDIIFLDIQMPEISGLDLAVHIHECSPETEIVFVTAYDQYALEAFNVQALDYLLKPVSSERLAQAVERIRKCSKGRESVLGDAAKQARPAVGVRCMGSLELLLEGQAPIRLKWRTAKIKELFAYLLHNRGQVISRDMLIELLWPEVEEKAGIVNLQTSVYRIRTMMKELGLQDALRLGYSQYGYRLEAEGVVLDSERWDAELRVLPPLSEATADAHLRVFHAYEGDYWGEDSYFWAEPERRRLKSMWRHHAGELAEYYQGIGKHREALALYGRMIKLDPALEQAHWAIMRIYDGMNDRSSVHAQYELLAAALEQSAGIQPDPALIAWYEQWSSGNK